MTQRNRQLGYSRFRLSCCVPLLVSLVLSLLTSQLIAQESGTEVSVEFSAPWPPWVTILIVTSAAIFTFGLYFREQSPVRNWFRFGMATLRFTLMCMVLWMMYGYTAQPFRTDLPDLLLFVDTSASMSTEDGEIESAPSKPAAEPGEQPAKQTAQTLDDTAEHTTRLAAAKQILLGDDAKLLRYLDSNYQTKLLTIVPERPVAPASVSEAVSEVVPDEVPAADAALLAQRVSDLNAEAESSRLGKQLRQALQQQRGRPVAAVVVLTDGITTDGPPLSEVGAEAKNRGIPFHIIGLGSSVPQRDVRLSDLLVDDVVFVNDLVTFHLTLSANGYKDETIDVELQSVDGTFAPVVEQVTIDSDSKSEQIRLAIKADQVGKFEFVIKTGIRDGESNNENNTLRSTVDVRDEETRVLLVQSYPSFEYHYLKTLFERGTNPNSPADTVRSGSVKLSVVLQEADPEFSEIDATALSSFPSRDELLQYDIVVFGDVNPTYLGDEAMTALRDFVVEHGRGFVGIAGAKYMPSQYMNTPLAEILPFNINDTLAPPADLPIEEGFQPRITPLGRRMPSMQLTLQSDANDQIWAELPELYWLLEVDSLKPGVRVLAEHPVRESASGLPLPVITLSYTGAGKVLFQNTDESWRWRIGRGDEYFARYWQQTLRYLSRFKLGEGRNVELTSDRESYTRGEPVRLRVRYFDERRAPSDQVVVLVEQAGRGQRRIALTPDGADRGIFSADVTNLGAGEYHAWISEPSTSEEAPSTDFKITTPNTERSRLEIDLADMQQAANTSGGEFYTAATARDLIDRLPVGKQVRIEPLPPEPLWNTWKMALLFLALLIIEWLSRRYAGLV